MKVRQQNILLFRADVLLYGGFLAACIALVWLLPFFPSHDGPGHIYNVVILRDLLHGQGEWGRFFVADVRLRPNMGFHLVAYPLLSVLSPFAAERAFLTVYILLLGAAVPVYLRAFEKSALPLAFFVFVVIFNRPLLYGFYSFVLGVPLMLFALALAWKLRQRSVAVRLIALNVAGFILYAVHLIPFAIFVMALGLMALSQAKTLGEGARRLATVVAVISPCLVLCVAGYLLARVRSDVALATGMEQRQLAQELWHRVLEGIQPLDLASFSNLWFSRWHTLPGLVALVLLLGAGLEAARRIRQAPDRLGGPGSSVRFLLSLCAALFALYLVTPNWMLNTGQSKLRFPWLILLLALPLIQPGAPRVSGEAWSKLLIILAVAAFSVNAAFLWRQGKQTELFMRGLQAPLPRGAVLMSVNLDREGPKHPDPFRGLASYYGLYGYMDYGNGEPQQPYLYPLRFRQMPPRGLVQQVIEQPEAIDWSAVPAVQFLLCWKAGEEDRSRLSQWFTLFWEESGCPLTIWKRK